MPGRAEGPDLPGLPDPVGRRQHAAERASRSVPAACHSTDHQHRHQHAEQRSRPARPSGKKERAAASLLGRSSRTSRPSTCRSRRTRPSGSPEIGEGLGLRADLVGRDHAAERDGLRCFGGHLGVEAGQLGIGLRELLRRRRQLLLDSSDRPRRCARPRRASSRPCRLRRHDHAEFGADRLRLAVFQRSWRRSRSPPSPGSTRTAPRSRSRRPRPS